MEDISGWKKLKATAAGVVAVASLFAAFSYGRFVNMTYPSRSFSVEGVGEAETVPDLARFTVSVVSQGGRDVSEVQQTNTDKMNRVNNYLKTAGVAEKDLKTGEYQLTPRYPTSLCEGVTCPAPTIVGYELTQTLEVKVREIDVLGDLLSGVVAAGANQVTDVRFTVDNEDEVRAEAREKAIAQAKEKAQAIATASGFRIGRLMTIYEDNGPLPYGIGGGNEIAEGAVALKAPALEPGTQKNTVQVTMTFEIKD